jgi:hypothetical protein
MGGKFAARSLRLPPFSQQTSTKFQSGGNNFLFRGA